MEPEGSLPRSQEPSTGPYPQPNRSNPYHPILSKVHFAQIMFLKIIIGDHEQNTVTMRKKYTFTKHQPWNRIQTGFEAPKGNGGTNSICI
jgi:hypothetical protein